MLPELPLLLRLCSHPDRDLGAAAAAVLGSLVRLHPREAAPTLAAPPCLQALLAAMRPEVALAGGGAGEEATLALLLALRAAVAHEPAAFRCVCVGAVGVPTAGQSMASCVGLGILGNGLGSLLALAVGWTLGEGFGKGSAGTMCRGHVLALRAALLTARSGTASQRVKQAAAAVLSTLQQ